MSDVAKHVRKLQYMADKGMRQLGPPRIGVFADRQRPEPLYCETNAWQQFLNIVYQESVQRSLFDRFVPVLAAPVTVAPVPQPVLEDQQETPVAGCGLVFLVHSIKEHYKDEKTKFNNISTWLKGDQAIAIARYGYRLVDCLEFPEESPAKSKVPPPCVTEDVCNCGRIKQVGGGLCHSCLQSQDIVNSAEQQKLSPQLAEIFKPYVCPDSECGQLFADNVDLQLH